MHSRNNNYGFRSHKIFKTFFFCLMHLSTKCSTCSLLYYLNFTLRYILEDISVAVQIPWELYRNWLDTRFALVSCHTGSAFCCFTDTNGGMSVRDWSHSVICRVSRDLGRSIKVAPQRLPNFTVYAV